MSLAVEEAAHRILEMTWAFQGTHSRKGSTLAVQRSVLGREDILARIHGPEVLRRLRGREAYQEHRPGFWLPASLRSVAAHDTRLSLDAGHGSLSPRTECYSKVVNSKKIKESAFSI